MSASTNGQRVRLETVPFEVDEAAEGFMVLSGATPAELSVERTARNDHLFMYNSSARRFEVSGYGSALIVNLLRMYEPEDPSLPPDQRTATPGRQLAAFDVYGNFYDRLLLSAPLVPPEAGRVGPGVKHTADFLSLEKGSPNNLELPIDDIYIFGLAKPIR